MLQNSTTNYFWDEAIIAALQYESELRISVYPKKHTAVEAGSFASQVNASAVKLENASAINIVGTVYEPSLYRDAAARVDDHEFPVLAQVFIRIYENDESMLNAYTYGLEKFGKQEIELLNSSLDLYELFNLIRNICADVINEKPNLFSEQINLSRCGKHFTFEESASNIFAVDTMKISVQNQV
ncbi:MAG: DUF4261 domain-containing protein [Erysipelothrix sp.]|nr:DUF4261 domain-containing protein [Erysipelothrix sp.]